MKKKKTKGFGYHLSEEVIKKYQEMPMEVRLKWLYMGNLLRMWYPKKIIRLQDKFRAGKM